MAHNQYSKIEAESLLSAGKQGSNSSSDLESYSILPKKPRLSFRAILLHVCVHIGLLTLYTIIISPYLRSKASPEDVISSPAKSAVKYEPVLFDNRLHQDNAYVGNPSPEVDKAWSDLVSLTNIKISGADLKRINKTSIAIPGEPDTYWGSLGVSHELHCLKRLRQAVYNDHYFGDLTPEEVELNKQHAAHCVEFLRQAAVCRGDISLTTFFWSEKSRIPVSDFGVAHACVNWDALVEWQRDRVFDPAKPGWLQHPKFGAAFPDGKGTKLGVIGHDGH